MNRQRIVDYINSKPIKAVESIDLSLNKIKYNSAITGAAINSVEHDEELCRAFLLTRLVNEFGYQLDRIEIEHQYTAGRPHTLTSRGDIIVRDSKGDVFLFVEAKKPDKFDVNQDEVIEEQLYKVAAMESAEGHIVKYLMLYTVDESAASLSDKCIIIDKTKFPTFSDWQLKRDNTSDIPSRYGKAQHRPFVKGTDKDLKKNFTSEALNQLQTDLHNVLWGGGGTDDNDVFSALTNLILAKIQDEDTTEDGETYQFQSLTFEKAGDEEFETNEELFKRINTLYRSALKSKLYILDEDELNKAYVVDTKKFSLSKLKYAVQKLESLSLVDGKNSLGGKDILGEFFEGIIRNGFKQSKGQFFTHTYVVRFMLWAIQADRLAIDRIKNDRELPYMIDPSAGSGTFLIEYMKFITENMKYRFRGELGTTRAVTDKIESDWFYPDHRENKWAQTYIYASESNFNLGTATKVNMILHGDGSTNIFVKDGLLPFSQYEKETAPNVMHDSSSDKSYNDKDINGNFDLILTNPPFSVNLDNDTKKTIKKSFIFGEKKNSENLFIERWYQLLRPAGRLAAILPESVFDTAENKYIRLFLYKYFNIKAVVSLPQLTFQPYTSTKTSILFAQKKTNQEIQTWNSTWEDASQEYGSLHTKVTNLVAVHDHEKSKAKLPSIKSLSKDQERDVMLRFLKDFVTEKDKGFTSDQLIDIYRDEISMLCKYDKDTADSFGRVNTWWVFGAVAEKISGNVAMFEVDNIGYKRTLRAEKETKNELYSLEYAPDSISIEKIQEDYSSIIDEKNDTIAKLEAKKDKEKNGAKKIGIKKRIEREKNEIKTLREELPEVISFIQKFYDNGKLKEEYSERDDEELLNEFKHGRLKKYASRRVALHHAVHSTVLDYMRDISWD